MFWNPGEEGCVFLVCICLTHQDVSLLREMQKVRRERLAGPGKQCGAVGAPARVFPWWLDAGLPECPP